MPISKELLDELLKGCQRSEGLLRGGSGKLNSRDKCIFRATAA